MSFQSIYDSRTGLFSGEIPEEFRAWVWTPREMMTRYDARNKRVDLATVDGEGTGVVVDYQPPQPTPDDADKTWTWNGTTQLWEAAYTLSALKREHWLGVKAAAKAEDQTDITISGNVLNADAASRALLFQKVQIAILDGDPFSVDWQLVDDTVVTLNGNQVKAIVRAINTREDAIRAKAHTLLAAIKNAVTKEEVLAIVWSFP